MFSLVLGILCMFDQRIKKKNLKPWVIWLLLWKFEIIYKEYKDDDRFWIWDCVKNGPWEIVEMEEKWKKMRLVQWLQEETRQLCIKKLYKILQSPSLPLPRRRIDTRKGGVEAVWNCEKKYVTDWQNVWSYMKYEHEKNVCWNIEATKTSEWQKKVLILDGFDRWGAHAHLCYKTYFQLCIHRATHPSYEGRVSVLTGRRKLTTSL